MRSLRAAAATLSIGALALALPLTPATASGDPWVPEPQHGFSVPAGARCDFGISGVVDREGVSSRVLESHADGSPSVIAYSGPLLVTVTNDETGKTVDLSLSGTATAWFRADGSLAQYETDGPVGFGFGENDGFAKGYYRLVGHHVLTFDPDGTRHMVVDQGDEQDVCAMLA